MNRVKWREREGLRHIAKSEIGEEIGEKRVNVI